MVASREGGDTGLINAGVGGVGPVKGVDVAGRGEAVEVEAGRRVRAKRSDVRGHPTNSSDVREVCRSGRGEEEVRVVAGYETAMGDKQRVGGTVEGEGGNSGMGGREHGGGEGGIDPGKGSGAGGRADEGVEAKVGGFFGEALEGEGPVGGRESAGTEEGEEDGEHVGIAINEDGSGGGGGGGEGVEEGVGSGRLESRGGGFKDPAADVELDAVRESVGGFHCCGMAVTFSSLSLS